MDKKKSNFGKLKDGRNVVKYSLENRELKIDILNYGGIITGIFFKDDISKNLVLGFNKIEDYEIKSPYFGCITGRAAGRIANGKFKIDETEYILEKNDGVNNLHGGLVGLDKRIWDVKELENGLELTYTSQNLEGGFPGKVEFTVKYTLEKENLIIEYFGETDRKTFINLTNHTYFNLSSGKDKILNHDLFIDADNYLELGADSIPTGKVKEVNGVFDRRAGGNLKGILRSHKDLDIVGGGFDHPFVLNKKSEKEIILEDKSSGKRIEMKTSEPVVVVYSGNYLKDEGELSNGAISSKHMAICLETQDYPDAPNQEGIETRYITSKAPYKTWTKYSFYRD